MTTEQLLYKWQALEGDDREKVLAFIDSLERQRQSKKSGSSLGKKLREIRQEIIIFYFCRGVSVSLALA